MTEQTAAPNDFFIVAATPVVEHATFDDALGAKRQMAHYMPEKEFRIFRCKRWMNTAKHFPKFVELIRDLVKAGEATPELLSRARILLQTIRNRNQTPHLERKHVPHFDPTQVHRS